MYEMENKEIPKCKCGGEFVVDDYMWASRKWCNKCKEDYIDLSG